MTKIYDLDQSIMDCWNVTSDLELLLEEVMENEWEFTRDDISNFVLGLQRIYESRFNKLSREFGSFVKKYHEERQQFADALNELDRYHEAEELADEARQAEFDAALTDLKNQTLDELFLEEEQEAMTRCFDENDHTDLDHVEDEFGCR